MSSGTAIIGVDITDVDQGTATFALGARGAVDSQTGVREYIYAQYAASTAFTVGQCVVISAAGVATPATTTNVAAAQTAGRRVGVVVAAAASLATAQFGWFQVYGISAVLANTACGLNSSLFTTATAGQVDDAATLGVISGIVLNVTTGGAPAVTACTLNYPFINALA